MYERFVASQPVEISVPDQPVPIQHYLRQPRRLVYALVDPTRLECLGNDIYRLKLRPLQFFQLSIQPTVDLRVRSSANGTVNLRSVACEVRGVEYINDRFSLQLFGRLIPKQCNGATYLKGIADLEVKVEMPPALEFTPRPILQAAGNALLKSVLMTIDSRLRQQLLADYRRWAGNEWQRTGNLSRPIGLSASIQ